VIYETKGNIITRIVIVLMRELGEVTRFSVEKKFPWSGDLGDFVAKSLKILESSVYTDEKRKQTGGSTEIPGLRCFTIPNSFL